MSMRPSEVVSVIRHRVKPGSDASYEAWTRGVVAIAQGFAGHQGVAVIQPPSGSREYTVVLHFDRLEHLKAWLDSDTRQRLLAEIEPHLLAPGDVEIRPGLDFWLPAPGSPRVQPVRQFLVAWSVIYPLSLLVPLLYAPAFGLASVPVVVRTGVTSGTVVALMTWVVMPRYSRLVARWLYGGH